MQNQAKVNFWKWHLNNSPFSKVNFPKSTVKSPIQRSNVTGRKWNNNDQSPIFQSPIWKDKFQTSNFKSSFQSPIFESEIFQIQFSVKRWNSNFQSQPVENSLQFSKSNFQGQRQVIGAWFSKSTLFEKSNNSNSNTWKWNISKSNFDRPISKANIFQVKSSISTRPSEVVSSKSTWFVSFLLFSHLDGKRQSGQRRKSLIRNRPRKLSTSASEELAFNQLWRPEDSRQSSAGLFTSPVTCNVWLVEVKKPAWALVRRNVQELGEMWWASMRFPFYTHRSLPRSSLPFDVVISHAKQAKEKTWRRKRKKKPHGAQQPIGPITLPRRWSPGAGQTLAYSPRASVWPESARCSDPWLEKVFCFLWRFGAAVFFSKTRNSEVISGRSS